MSDPVKIRNGSQIDVEDVRQFLMDRSVQDNLLDMDLNFSDTDIRAAFRMAAMEYNETPPKCHTVTPDALPFGATFLWGAAYYLLMGDLMKRTRQDIDYSAGGVTVDINARRIKHLKELLPLFQVEFKTKAKEQKQHININCHGYRAF